MSKFFPTFVQEKKPQRIMTKAELEFYERMPRLMHQLVEEVKSLTDKVESLTEEVKNLKNGTGSNNK
jgi:cell division protein FtsB